MWKSLKSGLIPCNENLESFQTFFVNTKFKYMFKVTTVFLSMHALFSMK